MKLIEQIHGNYIHGRRVESLKRGLLSVLPSSGKLLDIGCGDGLLASRIAAERTELSIEGIDVLVREDTHIPVTAFDGQRFPYADNSFDAVMFVDVLHHTDNPQQLLAEAKRVSRECIVLKDHNCNGLLAHSTLRFMDRVGNQRFGVELPYNYLSRQQWQTLFQNVGLSETEYLAHIDLYPLLLKPFFERQLHFINRLSVET